MKTIYDHLGMSKQAFEKLSQQFRDDAAWFHKHAAMLREKHAGKYVAVVRGKVFAEGREIDRVLQELKKASLDARLTYVGYVTPKPVDFI